MLIVTFRLDGYHADRTPIVATIRAAGPAFELLDGTWLIRSELEPAELAAALDEVCGGRGHVMLARVTGGVHVNSACRQWNELTDDILGDDGGAPIGIPA